MTKVLIATVGGSPEPIVTALLQGRPDFVYFLCSTGNTGSEAAIEETIVPTAQLAEGSYSIERVSAPDDLREVIAACSRIEADLGRRFPGEDPEVVANYTGGTKTMSAGLVALAQRRAWVSEVTARPARGWSGPVSNLRLSEITVFSAIDLACAEGLNVIIGENGTGKTHLLKSAYAVLRAIEEADTKPPTPARGDKLQRVLGGGARRRPATGDAPCAVRVECQKATFDRAELPDGAVSWSSSSGERPRALFLPSREALAMYPGFVRLYEQRDVPFDETYYDLCRELSALPLREVPAAFAGVLKELEEIIGGPVRLDFITFVVEDRRIGDVPAPMVAEGHRKLASLAYLIKNGALQVDSVLFWDEPEANLNPKLVREVARVIWQLAKAGVQIFLATHDYLLARELSIMAEYEPDAVGTRFFSVYRTSEDGPVEVESGARWAALQQNPIFDAYAAHDDYGLTQFAGDSPEEQS